MIAKTMPAFTKPPSQGLGLMRLCSHELMLGKQVIMHMCTCYITALYVILYRLLV